MLTFKSARPLMLHQMKRSCCAGSVFCLCSIFHIALHTQGNIMGLFAPQPVLVSYVCKDMVLTAHSHLSHWPLGIFWSCPAQLPRSDRIGCPQSGLARSLVKCTQQGSCYIFMQRLKCELLTFHIARSDWAVNQNLIKVAITVWSILVIVMGFL